MRILSVILLLIGSVAESLKIYRVVVPHHAFNGKTATLRCQFSLDNKELLYAVKWYKDNEEFFRYVPRFKPQIFAHPVDGVNVDKERSTNEMVTLNPVEMRSTGVYRCEVSAEAPKFRSDQGEGRMNVVYLPTEEPQITGNLKDEYEVGETLDLNCISSKSSPPAKISWYINDSPVNEPWVLPHEETQDRFVSSNNSNSIVESNLFSTHRRLRLQLKAEHFRTNGVAMVRCRASILTHDMTTSATANDDDKILSVNPYNGNSARHNNMMMNNGHVRGGHGHSHGQQQTSSSSSSGGDWDSGRERDRDRDRDRDRIRDRDRDREHHDNRANSNAAYIDVHEHDHNLNSHNSLILDEKEAFFKVRSSSGRRLISFQLISTAATFVLFIWMSS